ncbi:hypothetical protein [Chryseobacterium scophthalmum]|uniref:hypothetical protein n=1 Tax=Chryseobacterium scophthalmum TaxID=59733 RepID=UPI003D034E3A
MKNLRITLGIAALAIGSFAAFSFAPAKADAKLDTGVFYSNPDGSMSSEPVVGTSDCDKQSSPICSQEYDLETHQPTNNPALITRGERP